jgi:hypothetical protein
MRGPPAVLTLIAVAGCVDINGGSVELAWELFSPNGSACCPNADPCRAAGAQLVRVHLRPVSCDAPELLPVHTLGCKSTQGATQFDIPPGSYCIGVDAAPDAQSQAVASGPNPIVRDVTNGNIVELGAVALTVGDLSKCPANQNLCP